MPEAKPGFGRGLRATGWRPAERLVLKEKQTPFGLVPKAGRGVPTGLKPLATGQGMPRATLRWLLGCDGANPGRTRSGGMGVQNNGTARTGATRRSCAEAGIMQPRS